MVLEMKSALEKKRGKREIKQREVRVVKSAKNQDRSPESRLAAAARKRPVLARYGRRYDHLCRSLMTQVAVGAVRVIVCALMIPVADHTRGKDQ